MHSPILAPLMALVLWSFVMWAWLYATRIPAIVKNNIVLDPQRSKEEFNARLPARVRWKADNYNHLMEQPTLFYAVTLTLALIGEGAGMNAVLAWLYVGLRIVHSLVQAIVNIVMVRFAIFMVASVVLLVMALRAALAVL
ncbi:MAG: MAPEG family protein [Methylobacteriaceae bacterium]|nr:MAPEG family protein [Methylobacteriaceae bacterium]